MHAEAVSVLQRWTKTWPTADLETGLKRDGLKGVLPERGRTGAPAVPAVMEPSEHDRLGSTPEEECVRDSTTGAISSVPCVHTDVTSYHSSSGAGSSGDGGSSQEVPSCSTSCGLDVPSCCTSSKSRALASAALQYASLGAASDRGGRMALATSTTSRSPDFIFAALCDSKQGEGPAALCRERLAANVLGARRSLTKNNNGSEGCSAGAWRAAAQDGRCGVDGGDTLALMALSDGLAQTQEDIRCYSSPASTGVLALLIQAGGRALNLCWTGDCQAVLCRAGQPVVLTAAGRRSPDMPPRPGSVDSLDESSSTSTPGLVLKEPSEGFHPNPAGAPAPPSPLSLAHGPLPASAEFWSEPFHAQDEFLLLATRGLWALFSPAEAVRLARAQFAANHEPPAVAERLATLATARGERAACGGGDLTVQVVRLFTRTVGEQGRPAPSISRLRSLDGVWPSFLDIATTPNFSRVVGGF